MAEYAYNNSNTTATDMTPFYANYGRNPESTNPQRSEAVNPASYAYSHWIAGAIEKCREKLELTQQQMAQYADPKRKEPPAYTVGDAVMLSRKNIKIKRPSKKLDHKFLGPFQIEKIISPTAVRLTLPQKWKTHPSFHVSEIEPFVAGSRPSPNFEKILREISDIEAEEEYDVEEIKGSVTQWNRVLYHVKWLRYPQKKDWTYEPYENFSEAAREKLPEFHTKHPRQPRDHRLTAI